MMSLRQRLLMFLLLPLIPLSAFLIGMIYWAIGSATRESYDRVLEGSALAIADRVVLEGGSLVVDLPYAALQMLTNSAEDRVFYSVQKWPSGEVVTGYRNLPAPVFGETDTILQEIDFRIATNRFAWRRVDVDAVLGEQLYRAASERRRERCDPCGVSVLVGELWVKTFTTGTENEESR